MINYTPQDWYWQVTGVGIYGSARRGIVSAPSTDAAYLAFDAINGPGSIASSAVALDAVLTSVGLPMSGLAPATKPQLLAYANSKVMGLTATPRSYSLGSATILADATTGTIALVSGLADWGTANPTATQPWIDDFGTVTQITGSEAVTLKTVGLAYIQSIYAVLATAALEIKAGTITTDAQIDALAWPT
jgi:hypothetical protein